MALLKKFRRKPEITDSDRRVALRSAGRITEGVIIDTEPAEDGSEVVFYSYTLNGVDFVSSELMSPEQLRDPLKYAPGAKISVKYDPKNHGNSMLI